LTMPDNKSAVGRVGSAPTKLSVYCSYVFCKNRAEEVNERKSDSTLLISAAGRGRPSAGDLQLMGRSSSCCFFAPLGFLEPKKNCWVCDQVGGIILVARRLLRRRPHLTILNAGEASQSPYVLLVSETRPEIRIAFWRPRWDLAEKHR
jgi:hypothetical protein